MASGEFKNVAVESIIVNRETRQRRELTNIDELAASIRSIGLLNPLIVDRDHVLIAGERRLTACRQLGLSHVPVQYYDDLSDAERQLIELEENVRRVELSWQDHCKAVHDYHQLCLLARPDWTREDSAKALNIEVRTLDRHIGVWQEISKGNTAIAEAPAYTVARNLMERQRSREAAAIVAEAAPLEHKDRPPLENVSCHEWVKSYDGPPFNLLVCDFPYGIGFDKQAGQNSVNYERYDDSFETYQALVEDFLPKVPLAESAHMLFWFSMRHYAYTVSHLRDQGWRVNYMPLFWAKSDNSGILPDPKRGPRFNVETALLCSKGDRFITRAVSNVWYGARGEAQHASVKPREMLRHFMSMLVDHTTHMLDPTCGSGNSVRVAVNLGAARALGLEQNKTYWEDACRAWHE